MRTTLTLDDDVAAHIERLRVRDNRSLKQIVNDLLRVALAHQDDDDGRPRGPFTRPVSLGRHRLPDVDDVSEALAIAEGEDHR
jgi:hypothetical protein